MAEIVAAVTSALALAGKVLSYLYQETQKTKLQETVRDGVEEIKNWLMAIQAELEDTEGQEGNARFKDRRRRIRDVAYDIQDALDKFMVPHHHHTHIISKMAHKAKYFFTDPPELLEMSSKLENIKKKIEMVLSLDQFRAGVTNADEGSSSRTGMRVDVAPLIPKKEILGFENHSDEIINQLTGEERKRKTLVVVGFTGTGKSVLVKSVYKDRRVRRKFDCRFLSANKKSTINPKS